MARLRGFNKAQGPEDEEEKEKGQASYRTFDAPSPEIEPEAEKETQSEPEAAESFESRITAMPEAPAEQEPAGEIAAAQDTESVPAPAVAGSIGKIVKPENDLLPKYTCIESAVDSILNGGEYYEDYSRAKEAELIKSKEFVLAALAQNPDRFYAPETPKPADWLDEEYLTARAAHFFARTKESVKPEENAVFAENLYNYLLKSSFSPESYATVAETFKRVAKANAARVNSAEEGERMRESLNRFNEAAIATVDLAKQKFDAAAKAEEQRQAALKIQKSELAGQIDAMDFKF